MVKGKLPKKLVLPILAGPSRGCLWLISSGTFQYWMGNYEEEQVILFVQSLFSGAVVYDLGAHAGYYTILASKKVGEKGKVISFEPLPQNIFCLKKNVQLNKCRNVRIVQSAVWDSDGGAPFLRGASSFEGKIDAHGKLGVATRRIDSLVSTDGLEKPDVLKIDVQGGEFRVLLGAKNTLMKFKPRIFLSIHTLDLEKSCTALLSSMNYQIKKIRGGKGYASEIMAY